MCIRDRYKTRLQEEEGVLEGVKNELEDKERIIMELTHQLQKKDENLRHFDNDYSSKIEQLKKKNTLLNEQINRLKSYSKENNELKRKIESFEVEMREKQVTAEELDDEKNKMRLKLDDLRDKLSIVSEKEVSYKQELENLSQKLSINEKELALRKKRSAKYREAYSKERRKVLDLRDTNKFLSHRCSLAECYKRESLQFMSDLACTFRTYIPDAMFLNYDKHLRTLTGFYNLSEMLNNDTTIEVQFKKIEDNLKSFYGDTVKNNFLNFIMKKYASYVRTNNFLKEQLTMVRNDSKQNILRISKLARTHPNWHIDEDAP